MKQPQITCRQFFKLSAFGAGLLALPAVALMSAATASGAEEAEAA